MELKCLDEVKKQTGAWGSNRTFMELKFANAVKNSLKLKLVLIVPLWN